MGPRPLKAMMLGGRRHPVLAFPGAIARVVVLALVSAGYAFCVNGGVINGSGVADYVAGYSAPYFAALWAQRDSEHSRYWPAYHYGLYLWLAWFAVIPHYLLKTRGRGGIIPALGLSFALWTPVAAGVAGWFLYEELPDFR